MNYDLKNQHMIDMENTWTHGIPKGSVNLLPKGGAYVVRFQGQSSKQFSASRYGSLKAAEDGALAFRKETSDRLGLTTNQYRYVGETIEFQLPNGHIGKIDAEDIDLLTGRRWHAYRGSKCERYYVRSSENKTRKAETMHNLLCPQWKEVDHINRDGLDNRKANLRDGKNVNINVKNQSKRSDNTSGKTGVHYSTSKDSYIIQWPEDGKRRCKSFSVSRYGKDGAKRKAIEFRHDIDKRLGITNGYDSDDDELTVELPEADESYVPPLYKVNTSGVHGVSLNKNNFWVAHWSENGKQRSKSYSISKYGEEEALRLATAKRQEMRPERRH